jgi:hypothetical protein
MFPMTAIDSPCPKITVELPVKSAPTIGALVFANLQRLLVEYHVLTTRMIDRGSDCSDREWCRLSDRALEIRAACGVLNQLIECFPEADCIPKRRPAAARKVARKRRRR